jgi:hypothetical protein
MKEMDKADNLMCG